LEVIEAWDGPLEIGDDPDLQRRHEAYIIGRLEGRQVDRFYSSEFYGAHVSAALDAEDRRVDQARAQVPISATAIRQDPFRHRAFVPPRVYRDLVTWVVLLGAPSTGKTTLAEALAQHHATCWVPEYGREYWERHQKQRRLTPQQLVEIADGHREREDQAVTEANRWLFVDTDASTTRHFARYYHDRVEPRLDRLAEQTASRYDLVLLCEDDIPYDDSWDRSGEANRSLFQAWIKADLAQRRIPYHSLSGTLEQRLARVDALLAQFRKYPTPGSVRNPMNFSPGSWDAPG
jgi:HTH-type transcriptional repressor of NAD biosynthesis genes